MNLVGEESVSQLGDQPVSRALWGAACGCTHQGEYLELRLER